MNKFDKLQMKRLCYKFNKFFMIIISFILGINVGMRIERALVQSKACPVSFEEAIEEAYNSSVPLYTNNLIIIPLKNESLLIKKRKQNENDKKRRNKNGSNENIM